MPAEPASPYPSPQRPGWTKRVVPYSIATVLAAIAGTAIVGLFSQFNPTKSKALAVVTDPPGATIYVDGEKYGGLSNAELKLAPGKRKIRVEKAGYTVEGTAEQEIDLASANAPEQLAFKLVADANSPTPPSDAVGQATPSEPVGEMAAKETATADASPSSPTAEPAPVTPATPETQAGTANPPVVTLEQEVEKLKTVASFLLEQQSQDAAKAELKSEVSRLEQQIADLKSELTRLQSKSAEPKPATPLANADDGQTEWRAYASGGVVTVTNLMPETLSVRIAGIEYLIRPGDKATAQGLKPGTVTTEIVGRERPRVWDLGPPNFRQNLVIK